MSSVKKTLMQFSAQN